MRKILGRGTVVVTSVMIMLAVGAGTANAADGDLELSTSPVKTGVAAGKGGVVVDLGGGVLVDVGGKPSKDDHPNGWGWD